MRISASPIVCFCGTQPLGPDGTSNRNAFTPARFLGTGAPLFCLFPAPPIAASLLYNVRGSNQNRLILAQEPRTGRGPMAAETATQLKVQNVEAVSESPFYIPMTGPAARPRRSLKHEETLIVLYAHRDIGASPRRAGRAVQ